MFPVSLSFSCYLGLGYYPCCIIFCSNHIPCPVTYSQVFTPMTSLQRANNFFLRAFYFVNATMFILFILHLDATRVMIGQNLWVIAPVKAVDCIFYGLTGTCNVRGSLQKLVNHSSPAQALRVLSQHR